MHVLRTCNERSNNTGYHLHDMKEEELDVKNGLSDAGGYTGICASTSRPEKIDSKR